jgi:ribonucleoside-diphosphate reductase alpha chain
MYAYKQGCKGITYYRVGSIQAVVKQKGENDDSNEVESKVQKQMDEIEKKEGICPECGSELIQKEGCADCPNCSYSKCFL